MKKEWAIKSLKAMSVILVLVLPFIDKNPYHIRLATTIGLYTVLTLGLNVLVGLSGLLDMGYVAFFAVGAYTYALLASPQFNVHLPFLAVLPLAAGAAVALSLLIGLPTLRLKGDYLAIVTMGFAEITRILLQNLDRPYNITNGPNGIVQIDDPVIGPLKFISPGHHYYLILFFAVIAYAAYVWLKQSHTGLRLRALKDDSIAAESFGINVSYFRVFAFAVGAVYAGIAGVLFAGWQSAVFPQNFTLNELITLYCMVILGGVGNPGGALLGVAVLVIVPELLRGYSIYRMLIYGLVLIIMMIYRPQGILPARPVRSSLKNFFEDTDVHELRAPVANTETVLEARGICQQFGGLTALSGVSFKLKPGRVLSIIGPNGAGKTTLINILTGINKPTAGEFFLDGEKLNGLKPHRIFEKGLARTFQNLRLFNNLTVIENVMVGLKTQDYSRALRVLKFFGEELALRRDHLADNLSYAYRKTLEIARSLASNPKVILLDEPAAGMNPAEVEALMDKIKALKNSGCSIVLIEHQMPLVMGISDDIIVLDQGQKIAEGTPEEIRQNPLVARVYLGEERPVTKPKRKVVKIGEGEPVLELEGIEASYGHIKALHGVNLTVRRGEIVCLLGSNGAGKTTTIKTVLGSVKPDKGRVIYNGKNITGMSPSEAAKMGLGIVPEGRRVFARMVVEENLDLGAAAGINKNQVIKNKEYVFSLFPRLKERRHQKAGTLSGGEQQMLAIGRALMAQPKVLLLDEPSMGLAPIIVDKIFEAIRELNLRGTTVLMVEQNAKRALEIADRGYVLQNGKIVVEGASSKLLSDEDLKTAYLG